MSCFEYRVHRFAWRSIGGDIRFSSNRIRLAFGFWNYAWRFEFAVPFMECRTFFIPSSRWALGEDRELSFTAWVDYIAWRIWTHTGFEEMGVHGRVGALSVADMLFGKAKIETKVFDDSAQLVLTFPEGNYSANVKLLEIIIRRPRWFSRRIVRMSIATTPGVPYPETPNFVGEIYEMSTDACDCYDAAGKFIAHVLRARARYPRLFDEKGPRQIGDVVPTAVNND